MSKQREIPKFSEMENAAYWKWLKSFKGPSKAELKAYLEEVRIREEIRKENLRFKESSFKRRK